MHTIKITPNLLFEYQCTSSKFIRLPKRIESKKSIRQRESNRNFFLPELECSNKYASYTKTESNRITDMCSIKICPVHFDF